MKFWNFSQVEATEEVELRISGEIIDDDNAWIYEWFGIPSASPNAFRKELAECTGKNINVWIDSWGGDVTAAAGIYNALKEHKGTVTVKIDGKAVSAASVIAMAGDKIAISPVGFMMIHNPWTSVQGEAKDMRKVADTLDVIKDTIMNAYQLKTGKSRDEISAMMDDETYMSAKTAKEQGFVDEVLYSGDKDSSNQLENSFMFNSLAIQNSASAGMRKFIEQNKGKLKENEGEKELDLKDIKTIDDLKNAFPQLSNQLCTDSVTNERNRMAALDALDDQQNATLHAIIVDAKQNGKTADEMQTIVDIVKKNAPQDKPAEESNPGQDFMKKVIEDNKNSKVDGVLLTGGEQINNDAQQTAADVSYLADLMNKKNGVKK